MPKWVHVGCRLPPPRMRDSPTGWANNASLDPVVAAGAREVDAADHGVSTTVDARSRAPAVRRATGVTLECPSHLQLNAGQLRRPLPRRNCEKSTGYYNCRRGQTIHWSDQESFCLPHPPSAEQASRTLCNEKSSPCFYFIEINPLVHLCRVPNLASCKNGRHQEPRTLRGLSLPRSTSRPTSYGFAARGPSSG